MHSLTVEEIRQALACIDAHDRDTWVRMAMAVKSELGEAGFETWDQWSATASNYRAKDARTVWRSIRPIRITIGSLIAKARANGWIAPNTPPQPETKAERARRRQAHQAREREEAKRIEAKHAAAASAAQALLDKALVREGHPYLKDKHLGTVKALVHPDGALIVPMRHHRSNALQGAQIIRLVDNAWSKKMLPGMCAKGAVLRLGPPRTAELILCEGYATGLSIELAIRQLRLSMAVVVCFSDSNMVYVAGGLDGRRYVFADHDQSEAGERAANKTGLPYCMSDQLGEDANDLHARAGLLAVCAKLMEVRRR